MRHVEARIALNNVELPLNYVLQTKHAANALFMKITTLFSLNVPFEKNISQTMCPISRSRHTQFINALCLVITREFARSILLALIKPWININASTFAC